MIEELKDKMDGIEKREDLLHKRDTEEAITYIRNEWNALADIFNYKNTDLENNIMEWLSVSFNIQKELLVLRRPGCGIEHICHNITGTFVRPVLRLALHLLAFQNIRSVIFDTTSVLKAPNSFSTAEKNTIFLIDRILEITDCIHCLKDIPLS